MPTVTLKLVVDTKRNRVVFAESEKEFVDILFSFLTLPMGTIIRLLNKESSVGCMDNLYMSVENLDYKCLETVACKMMLLWPRSEAEILCEDLVVNADVLMPRRLYRCPTFGCFIKNKLYSSFLCTPCLCGKAMDQCFSWVKQENNAKNSVFLKEAATYVITDDLRVTRATAITTVSLLQNQGIEDADVLEERIVHVGRSEVLSLLKSLLLSKMPFTDVFLQKKESVNIHKEENDIVETAQTKSEVNNEAIQSRRIRVKVVEDKVTEEAVYAVAGNDFVDVLLSFLTFPLGSIVKLLNCQSSVVCVDNLYNSVELLAATGDYIKSEECKDMLLSPKFYPHFNCDNQILKVEAKLPRTGRCCVCKLCWNKRIGIFGTKCKSEKHIVHTNEINPKKPNSSTENGGGYAKRSVRFMVTNEMDVKPVSLVSEIGAIKELKVPISSLVEKEVELGEAEVLNLLKACLVSSNPLSKLFSP
ncbi:uncharacterized protein LOC109837509 [Asparagus officinalis]|uniref:uncharacterized protein LOC109837509 n=1 Tax=Asparagus officinalis TaxID=4686 RepID=UPI00098E5626|nr:uncharacterized protein LOC109837509 [Asparagus officinalis]XP_020261380.1 uncharacterized protein LOC109837509 [Asparagus officinalis]